MAIPFEEKLIELAITASSDAVHFDASETDRELAELRKDGWELASTSLSIRRLSAALIHSYVIQITYTLQKGPLPHSRESRKKG